MESIPETSVDPEGAAGPAVGAAGRLPGGCQFDRDILSPPMAANRAPAAA